jgi:hypothetical protein
VVKPSSFLHPSQKLEALKELLAKGLKLDVSPVELGFVDGYECACVP